MPRNKHFLLLNNGNRSESIPQTFFGTKFRSQPCLHYRSRWVHIKESWLIIKWHMYITCSDRIKNSDIISQCYFQNQWKDLYTLEFRPTESSFVHPLFTNTPSSMWVTPLLRRLLKSRGRFWRAGGDAEEQEGLLKSRRRCWIAGGDAEEQEEVLTSRRDCWRAGVTSEEQEEVLNSRGDC